jgi:hypothetical protein
MMRASGIVKDQAAADASAGAGKTVCEIKLGRMPPTFTETGTGVAGNT